MKSYEFMVEYPWGSSFVDSIRDAVTHFGYYTATDPLTEGGDDSAILISKNQNQLRKVVKEARKLIESDKVDEVLELYGSDGLVYILQDWKHLDWESDAEALKGIDLTLKLANKNDMDIFVISTK